MKSGIRSIAWWMLAVATLPAALADDRAHDGVTSMRPSLVALQVENLDASILWYRTHLGFQQKDRKEFPGQGLRLAILGLHDFDLELVENARTLKKSGVLAEKKATDITGFAKVTFAVTKVDDLFRRLHGQGARFAIPLRASNVKPDEQFFVVLDNDGNWLQFIGKK